VIKLLLDCVLLLVVTPYLLNQVRKPTKLIQAGRVQIEQASASRLPFADEKFDLVTAVETLYYWPNPATDLQEVLRVLKPGGTLVIISAAGYKDIQIFEERKRGWICGIGTKADDPD